MNRSPANSRRHPDEVRYGLGVSDRVDERLTNGLQRILRMLGPRQPLDRDSVARVTPDELHHVVEFRQRWTIEPRGVDDVGPIAARKAPCLDPRVRNGPAALPTKQNNPGDGRHVATLIPRHQAKRLQVLGCDRATAGERPPHCNEVDVAGREVTDRRLVTMVVPSSWRGGCLSFGTDTVPSTAE